MADHLPPIGALAGVRSRGAVLDLVLPGGRTRAWVESVVTYMAIVSALGLALYLWQPARFPPWSWGVAFGVTLPFVVFISWTFVWEYPIDLRLSGDRVEIRYSKVTLTSPWANLRPLYAVSIPFRGVSFGYAPDPNEPVPTNPIELREYRRAHPGRPEYFLTTEQTRAVLLHPSCPRWKLSESVRRRFRIPWEPAVS